MASKESADPKETLTGQQADTRNNLQAIAKEFSDFLDAHPGKKELSHDPDARLVLCLTLLDIITLLGDCTYIEALQDVVKEIKEAAAAAGDPEAGGIDAETLKNTMDNRYNVISKTIAQCLAPYCAAADLPAVLEQFALKYSAAKGNGNEEPRGDGKTKGGTDLDTFNKVLSWINDQCGDTIDTITVRKIKELYNPIDKINNSIWDNLETDTGGQISFDIKAEPNSSETPVNLVYAINFDNIESDAPIVKRLGPFDKRVYVAVGGLVKNGYYAFTTTQIYHAMGHNGKPGKYDREKIDKAMTKFHAIIYLSNEQEIEAGYNYPSHIYDGPLLPFYRDTELNRVNGQPVESTYRVTLDKGKKQIPLIDFAAERKQVQTISPDVFQVGLSDTDTNIAIQDYLLERIARARNDHSKNKILLSTLYDRTNQTTRKQKERAPGKITKCLDHYRECGLISGYTMDKQSIVLKF